MNSTTTNNYGETLDYAESYAQHLITVIVLGYCLLVHLAYFLLVCLCHELRTKPFLFVNHAVLANTLTPAAGLIFQFVDPVQMPQHLTRLLCPIFEIIWPLSIFIRSYSIVLIAIHRYLAVFCMFHFNQIRSSNKFYALSILAAWVFSLGLTVINKLIFNTTYSIYYCADGSSPIPSYRLFYAFFLINFGLIMPTVFIVYVYIVIIRKLRKTQTKLVANGTRASLAELNEVVKPSGQYLIVSVQQDGRRSSSSVSSGTRLRETKFANQFISMSIVVVLMFFGMSFISLKNVFENYFVKFYVLRVTIRCSSGFIAALIPIFSWYFNPSRVRLFNFVKNAQASDPPNPVDE